MALNLEKYIHLLGVNTVSGLVTYIGLAWLASFVLLMLIIYPLSEIGILQGEALAGAVALAVVVSFIMGFSAILIPAKLKQEDIDKNFPVFIAFLGSITTAKTNYEEFFKTLAETAEYGEISKEMKRLYHLAQDWKLGYAKACKVVADTTPSKLFSDFLARLSQVVEYGEDISFFFKTQYKDIMRDMQTSYQEATYGLTTTAEMFSALFVSAAFLIAFAILMPIFFPVDPDTIAIGAAVAVIGLDLLLFIMARSSAPTDKFANDFPESCPEHTLAVLATMVGVIVSAIFFLVAWVLEFPPIYQVGLSALPLIVPGILAMNAERTIRRREHSYIPFIRTLGDITAIREGAVAPVLKQLRKHIYPGLNEAIDRLYKRLIITRQVFRAFKLFSKEIGSALVSKFNELFVKALYAGADPRETGAIVGDQMHAILDARRLRLQIASGAKGVLYGAYIGVALGVFLAVKAIAQVFNLFSTILSTVQQEVAGYFTFFNFNVNLFPLVDFLVYLFAFEAAVIAIIIKIMDGGLMTESTRHYVLLILALVAVYFITDYTLSFLFPVAEEAAGVPVPGVAKP